MSDVIKILSRSRKLRTHLEPKRNPITDGLANYLHHHEIDPDDIARIAKLMTIINWEFVLRGLDYGDAVREVENRIRWVDGLGGECPSFIVEGVAAMA